jgi:hypothetical protein
MEAFGCEQCGKVRAYGFAASPLPAWLSCCACGRPTRHFPLGKKLFQVELVRGGTPACPLILSAIFQVAP